jgi:ATP-dependent Clp protease ATP-binding subunit ClpB
MTSNIGSQEIFQSGDLPSEEIASRLKELLMQYFRPEFLNRLDDIIIFHRLNSEHIKEIVKLQLSLLQERLKDKQIQLIFDDSAINELAKEGFDPQFGARPLKRVIQKEIENRLAVLILENKFNTGDTVRISYHSTGYQFSKDE